VYNSGLGEVLFQETDKVGSHNSKQGRAKTRSFRKTTEVVNLMTSRDFGVEDADRHLRKSRPNLGF
jgi:hypothetical protein